MKKNILFASICTLIFSTSAYANFDYGVTTYETADDTLVVNSLGDQPIVSKFGALGTNDWIQESGVKNQLKIDGYSVAYDYNPTANHDWGVYNQPLPSGDFTKLTFAGLLGDPRVTQDVYVLSSEYNRLSAQGQANSIDNLNSILNVTNNNTNNTINNLAVANASQMVQQRNAIDSLNNRVDQVSNRVSDLEKTQDIIGGVVRIYDSRKWQVNAFLDYTATRNTVSEVGIRVTYKMGKSYEEKEMDALNARLNKLEGIKNEKEKVSNSQTYYTGNGIGIKSKF